MTTSLDPFLDSQVPLTPADSVAVIVVLEDGRYLLQHRDSLPQIFYPDHWGFFGGAIDAGEDEEEALRREIEEELGWKVETGSLQYFTSLTFDLAFAGRKIARRVFYELTRVPVKNATGISLGEGQSVEVFEPRVALGQLKLTPLDSFALWLHTSGRARMCLRVD